MAKLPPETNPFLADFSFKAVWKMEKPKASLVSEDARTNKTELYVVNPMDREDRAQVFTKHLFHWFKDLPASAKDMFLYIACHLGYQTDVIELIEDKYCDEADVTTKTFYAARRMLINRLIIPRQSRKNTYWVNPTYLFKGNRMESFSKHAIMENDHPFEKLTNSSGESLFDRLDALTD